jgi:RHS repeat-associated protein
LGLIKSNKVYRYHLDHLGTPEAVSNKKGKVVWYTTYSSYGNLAVDFSDKIPAEYRAEILQPFRFQGRYADAETGLYYNRHRYYDPNAASFITPDPIKLLGGVNNYQYVPNPISWVDPLGLSDKEGWGKAYTNTLGDIAKQTAAEQNELHGQTSGWGNVMQGIYKPIEDLGRGLGNTVGLLEAIGPKGISPQVKGYWAGVGQGIKDLGGLACGAATGDPKTWAQLTPAIVSGAVLRKMLGGDKNIAKGASGQLGRVDGTYSAINPDPLRDNIAGGRYQAVTLEKDTVFHRAGTADQALGQFLAQMLPQVKFKLE